MTSISSRHFAALAFVLASSSFHAHAQTGTCDANGQTSANACIAAVQAAGGVVNDIYRDSLGRTGPNLPVFATLYNAWPGCTLAPEGGCGGGISTAPYDCPGAYVCQNVANTFANAADYLSALDHRWWQPGRITDHTLLSGCPRFTTTRVVDGNSANYIPREGLVFDLRGPSNQVVIFAENDHGPQPCESAEYTVFLSDNPMSDEIELNPTTIGVDPNKWNRAVLKAIYTHGWFDVRTADPTGHAACGDTVDYAVEDDSFTTVYALPCGLTFRYAAIVAGNDGRDFAACQFHSSEGEIDAVAGLTESGAAVCGDADGDRYVDCGCMGAPTICDCDDTNPAIHPGAPEDCDDPDLNCDTMTGVCPGTDVCAAGRCLALCDPQDEFSACPPGSTCGAAGSVTACVPSSCTSSSCPGGSVCSGGTCVPACTGVVCPSGQICQEGSCVDPCEFIQCAAGRECHAGVCVPPCRCLAANLGCASQPGTACDSASGECVDPSCVGVSCTSPNVCSASSGTCVPRCMGVVCPQNQHCTEADGCIGNCVGVSCDPGETCDPSSGTCTATSCPAIPCGTGLLCDANVCVPDPDAGVPDGGSDSNDAGTGNGGDAGSDAGNGGGRRRGRGCGCTTAGSESSPGTLAFVSLAGIALVFARRRTRR